MSAFSSSAEREGGFRPGGANCAQRLDALNDLGNRQRFGRLLQDFSHSPRC